MGGETRTGRGSGQDGGMGRAATLREQGDQGIKADDRGRVVLKEGE
jgi:hypothetical protein